MGEYPAPISFARNRLLVSDGGHTFDVVELAAAWLKGFWVMIAAARLTLLELAATSEGEHSNRQYFAKPGEADWGC